MTIFETHPILSQTDLKMDALSGKIVIVSGAGGGIGYEAVRSLLWLGAVVVIAELDRQSGRTAEQSFSKAYGTDRVRFIQTDVGNESSVRRLIRRTIRAFGKVDILINNATIAPLGLIKNTPIAIWDASYRVNLRGPVMLARAVLPGMLAQDQGIIINVSSTGTAYMGAYETFKAGLVHLTQTLEAELEGTGLFVFTISPGLVPTKTATQAIMELAPQLDMSLDEFYEINANAMLSAEEAGAGYAAAIIQARQFHGQEISCLQALIAVGYDKDPNPKHKISPQLSLDELEGAQQLAIRIRNTLFQQTEGWNNRSLFERQWMIRDFKRNAGMPVEGWKEKLDLLVTCINHNSSLPDIPLIRLSEYYNHLANLAKGYEKDSDQLAENLRHIYAWRDDVIKLDQIINE